MFVKESPIIRIMSAEGDNGVGTKRIPADAEEKDLPKKRKMTQGI